MTLQRLLLATLGLGAICSSLGAAPITLAANLGDFENPPTGSAGTGFAAVTLDVVAHTLDVDFDFSGLTGLTTAAHIHCCVAAPGNTGVATQTPTFISFPVGVSSGSYLNTFDTTLVASFNPAFVTANGGTAASAEAALLAGLQLGNAYLNIHTTSYPAGEIRGFLVPVPEPATFALTGVALAAIALRRRRRSA